MIAIPYQYLLNDTRLRVGIVQAGDQLSRQLRSWLFGWYILNPRNRSTKNLKTGKREFYENRHWSPSEHPRCVP